MANFAVNPEHLKTTVESVLGDKIKQIFVALNELVVVVAAKDYLATALALRDSVGCKFEQMIDLCGVDYLEYPQEGVENQRFCVVVHLLSVGLNQRIRLKVFCDDNEAPQVASVTSIWASANWFEREAFDLFGIVFAGHADLRRLLTDYGFVGHPFRKDFPISGHVEMRYDDALKRVVYQPVTIEPRDITPRIVREEKYGGLH